MSAAGAGGGANMSAPEANESRTTRQATLSRNPAIVALAWLAVGLPLLWGVAQTLRKALALFH